nr:uncharacterized protein LOC128697060 [Cherax quadricarinatus]
MNLLYYFIVVILTSSVLRGGPGGRRLGKQDGVGVQALVVGHPLVVGHEGVDVAERAGGLRRVPGDHQRDGLLQPAVGYPHVYHSYYEDDHLSDDDLSDDDLSDDDLSDDDFWDDFWGDLFSDDDSDMSDSDDDDDGFYDYYRHQTLWDPPVTYRDGRQGAGSGQVLAKVDKGSLTASDEVWRQRARLRRGCQTPVCWSTRLR